MVTVPTDELAVFLQSVDSGACDEAVLVAVHKCLGVLKLLKPQLLVGQVYEDCRVYCIAKWVGFKVCCLAAARLGRPCRRCWGRKALRCGCGPPRRPSS